MEIYKVIFEKKQDKGVFDLNKAGEFERYVIAGDINDVFKVLKDKEQIKIIEITQISSGNVFIEE